MSKQLPVEIWLRVLFYCPDPKPLSQTQKKLHALCLNPVSTARWFSYQFGKQSMYAALFFWAGKSDIYRYWILQFRPNLMLPKSRKKLKRLAHLTYTQNWFHIGKKSICTRCKAAGSENYSKFDEVFIDQTLLEQQIHKHIIGGYCSFERYQLAICKYLIKDKAEIQQLLPLLVRYAASVGHVQLLKYFISLCSSAVIDHDSITSKGDERASSLAERKEILSDFTPCITRMLFDAARKGKIIAVYICLKTDILNTFDAALFTELITELLTTCSISITSLILNEKPKSIGYVHFAASLRLAGFTIYGKKIRTKYELLSMMFAKEMPDDILREEEPLITAVVSEFGRVDLIRYFFLERSLNFSPNNNLPLFHAALFGYTQAVKVLLEECNVNPSMFHSGRVTLFAMLLVDYILVFICLLNSEISVLNEIGCRLFMGQGPTVTMFYINSVKSFCMKDSKYDTPFTSVFIFMFFFAAYTVLATFTSLSGLIRSLYMIKKRARRSKRIESSMVDLENQNSAQTLMMT